MALKDAHIREVVVPDDAQPSQIASPSDYEYCRKVMLAASRNYSFASQFLPSGKRRHVDALYAFLRVGDDRVDVSHGEFSSPFEAIDAWESAYWQAFERGDSPDAVMRAYLETAIENGIPAKTMTAYFRAMKDDLVKTRFATFDELLHYMDGSAIPVGRAMTHILGVRESYSFSEAILRADALAVAMQLSNFWRDIGQDWQIGRVYLPQEDLAAFEVSEEDLAAGRVSAQFINLLEFQFKRTEEYYTLANEGVQMLAAGQWGVMSSLLIYQAIINSIRQNQYDVFSYRARTSLVQKFSLIFNAFFTIRKPRIGRAVLNS
ncbi:MAG: phytoene/squalene synthase family protein [Chloroflexota bacterium]|nr:MAG: phytoene/squalene synthase family protein [Chloroflexota bacterium]